MNEEQEIHLEVLKELSRTNTKLVNQLEVTMNVLKDKEHRLEKYRNTCRQIFQHLDNNKKRDVLELAWHQALHDVLKEPISNFLIISQEGHYANELH